MPAPPRLTAQGLVRHFAGRRVVDDVSLSIEAGQVTCLLGPSGCGKSTTLRMIAGVDAPDAGMVRIDGQTVCGDGPAVPPERRSVGLMFQDFALFPHLSVAENIDIGLMTRGKGAATRDRVLDLFPRLRERLGQRSSTLSGGEQQMLAIARALCLEPAVLLLDEPTEGLQPSMIGLIRDTVVALKATGVAIVLVEQRVDAVLAVADRVAFVSSGAVAEVCAASDLRPDSPQFARHVGV